MSDNIITELITIENEGQRIDKYISDMLPDVSRSYIQKLIKEGNITVNDRIIKANYKLMNTNKLNIILPEPKELEILPEDIELDIVYEDNDLLIVNKPKGMVVHPAAGHISGTLVNALLFHCRNNLSGINGILRPGIVHRIDKDTTGLLIVCKNDKAHNFIASQLAEHSITRTYHAIATGHINEAQGTIDKAIARDKTDRKKMSINSEGKRAVTHYNVINLLENRNKSEKYSYIKCNLETGRTHQIRVHMSSIHHPLLGDTVYGSSKQPYDTQGQVLHAKTIGFIHPSTKKYLEFDSSLPQYFVKLIDKMTIC